MRQAEPAQSRGDLAHGGVRGSRKPRHRRAVGHGAEDDRARPADDRHRRVVPRVAVVARELRAGALVRRRAADARDEQLAAALAEAVAVPLRDRLRVDAADLVLEADVGGQQPAAARVDVRARADDVDVALVHRHGPHVAQPRAHAADQLRLLRIEQRDEGALVAGAQRLGDRAREPGRVLLGEVLALELLDVARRRGRDAHVDGRGGGLRRGRRFVSPATAPGEHRQRSEDDGRAPHASRSTLCSIWSTCLGVTCGLDVIITLTSWPSIVAARELPPPLVVALALRRPYRDTGANTLELDFVALEHPGLVAGQDDLLDVLLGGVRRI